MDIFTSETIAFMAIGAMLELNKRESAINPARDSKPLEAIGLPQDAFINLVIEHAPTLTEVYKCAVTSDSLNCVFAYDIAEDIGQRVAAKILDGGRVDINSILRDLLIVQSPELIVGFCL